MWPDKPDLGVPDTESWVVMELSEVTIMETGPGISVQQTWTGSDGSMTGTVIAKTILYDDFGKHRSCPARAKRQLPVHVPRSPAPCCVFKTKNRQSYASRRQLPTTESAAYFVFLNATEAQDAYAHFL